MNHRLHHFCQQLIGVSAFFVTLSCTSLAQSSAISWHTFVIGGGVSVNASDQLRSSLEQTFSGGSSRAGNSQVAAGFLQGVKGTGGTDAVKPGGTNVPRTYILEQNYPNPFNPSTVIRYALPQRSYVTLFVYNVLGQRVAALVDGEVEAGYHQVTFNGAGLASGVYLYQLKAGEFAQTRRLVLLR